MLKAEVSKGNKNMTSDFEPSCGDLWLHQSKNLCPTISTTCNYMIFGDINGTNFDVAFSCSPAGVEKKQHNMTIQPNRNQKMLLEGHNWRIWISLRKSGLCCA